MSSTCWIRSLRTLLSCRSLMNYYEHWTVRKSVHSCRERLAACVTRKPCYRKDDRAMRPKLFILILLSLTATIRCADLILNEFKLWKFCLFLQEWRFSRSRSSEVIDFGANRKRVCDFLLVRNSNIGPILHLSEIWQLLCAPGPTSIIP